MPNRELIVIGASAGGVEALIQLVQGLPADLPAALCVTLHFPSGSTSFLPSLLNRRCKLQASHPTSGTSIEPGHIYVAPPDHHLLVEQGQVWLSRSPRENGLRPAINPLFRSAARDYGNRTIGVILSGLLDDGTIGLTAIKQQGAVAIAQDPEEALFNSMPCSAIRQGVVDYVLPIADIAKVLIQLTQDVVEDAPMSNTWNDDAVVVQQDKARLEQAGRSGEPSMLTCPDCGGVLWEVGDRDQFRFRCHVGHAYSADSLVDKQRETVESALWTAVRVLEERAALARRMATQAEQQQRQLSAQRFQTQAVEMSQHAATIQQILKARDLQDNPLNQSDPSP